MDWVVPEGHQKDRGGGRQWWWRMMSPCASLTIMPFGEVSENFNQWFLWRIRREVFRTLFEAIW